MCHAVDFHPELSTQSLTMAPPWTLLACAAIAGASITVDVLSVPAASRFRLCNMASCSRISIIPGMVACKEEPNPTSRILLVVLSEANRADEKLCRVDTEQGLSG